MNLFDLFATITIETKDAETKIETLMQKAKGLKEALSDSGTVTGNLGTTGGAGTTGNTVLIPSGEITLAGAAAWRGVFKELEQLATTGIERNAEMELYIKSFQNKLDISDTEAADFANQLKDFAKDTPLSMSSVLKSADQLLSIGTPMEEVIERLTVLGNNIMGDDSKLYRATKAYTDVMGYDQLNAQEIRQNVENGIYIRELLADSLFGKDYTQAGFLQGLKYIDTNLAEGFMSTYSSRTDIEPAIDEVINNLLEDHAITANEYWNALVYAQEYGAFKDAMTNMMNTSKGASEKAEDAYVDFAAQNTMWLTELKKQYDQAKTKMYEQSIKNTEEFINNPANTLLMQNAIKINDTISDFFNNLFGISNIDAVTEKQYKNVMEALTDVAGGAEPSVLDPYKKEMYGPEYHQLDWDINNVNDVTEDIKKVIAQIPELMREGIQNASINVIPGDVVLNTGALVGNLLPGINRGLGNLVRQELKR